MRGGMPLHHRFAAVPLPKHSLGRIGEAGLFLPKFHLGRGTVRRTVEGQAIASLSDDIANDAVQIAKHLAGRNTQDGHAMLREKRIAPRVPLRPVSPLMGFPIDLHRKLCRRAVEVEHIRPRRMLPAKTQAFRPLAQDTPQHDLRQRQVAPEMSRSSYRPARLRRYSHRPSTMLRMVPLPKHSLGRNEVETHV